MYPLLESIKLEGGVFYNLSYHQERVNRSREKLYGTVGKLDLEKHLRKLEIPAKGTFKCRVCYGKDFREMECLTYRENPISTLRVIRDDQISYNLKFSDRRRINELFKLRECCDDILIVKNNLITDSSYCNILFFDGRAWFTPHKPLLLGTQRQKLLDEGKVKSLRISLGDLQNFQKFMLVNAMLGFDEERARDISAIQA